MILTKKGIVFIIMIVFGILYSLISLVNHYYFRTYALDLGTYTNALYDYAHFQWNDSSVFKAVKENLLSDHFDGYLMLFSPLSLIFKSYTLLVVQILCLLFGGYGVYKYFSLQTRSTIPFFATLYFFIFFGVLSAVSFDYHSNVVAVSLVPWFFYLLKRDRIFASILLLLLILISKENTSLWMAFICLGLMIEYLKNPVKRACLLLSVLGCILYFIVITSIVMPALSNNHMYSHFHYSYLGNNSWEAILGLFKHPIDSVRVLFVNHTSSPNGDYIKAEFHILVLISGLPFLVRKPQYLLMLIPLYFQKLFNDDYVFWSFDGQYSVEFAPVLAIGIFSVIKDIKNPLFSRVCAIMVLITTFICTVRTMDSTIYFTDKSRIRIYQASHYTRNYDVHSVYRQIARIPENAIVSAQSPFLPHMAYRDNIYEFPMIRDAEYIVYSPKEEPYPIDKNTFGTLTFNLENSKDWKVLFKDQNLTVLRKARESY
jgi:uncharacterized membrane protein